MKKLLTIALTLLSGYTFSQCTLTGLQSNYCASDSGSQLTANCTGGTPQIIGPGVSPSGFFDPSQAGLDSIPILVLEGGSTYTIDQSGTFNPDTTSGGTNVSLGDDAVSAQLPIGFTFRFFENQYTTFQISSNGFITFGSNTYNGCCSGQFLPNATLPNNLIAFAWEDLNPSQGGTISYQTVGTAPNRKLLVNFNAVPHFYNVDNVTTQLQLWEGCGRIEIHTTTQPATCCNHTMGIENSSGTSAYTVPGRNAQSWTISNDYVAIIPNCGDTFWTVVSDGPDLEFSLDSNACFGDSNGAASVTATGIAPFTYEWSTGATTSSISGLSSGSYPVSVTDGDGCVKVESANIFTPPALNLNLDSDSSICETDGSGAITANIAGGTAPYSYSWSNGETTPVISGLDAGLYTLTITDANNCENVTTSTVHYLNEDPTVSLGDDKTICPDNIAFLVTSPGYAAYNWSNGATTNSTVVSSAGIYTVTVTTQDGCEGSDEIEVVAAIPVQVDLGADIEGAAPINISAEDSAFTQYLWSTGSTNSSINVATSGNYKVTVSDTNGCNTNDNIRVDIWPNSIDELNKDDFAIFPNPAADVLNIIAGSDHSEMEISLFDMNGKLIVTKIVNLGAGQQDQINVSQLPAGNYTLKLQTDEVLEHRQVIVQ
ncbi:MAG: T9SS type A sorting domain-containing protein [Salibacteraceae bacterium]